MSDTQEKLEEKFAWITHNMSPGVEKELVEQVQALIESAKREGAIEELEKLLDFPIAVKPNSHFGYDDMVFLDDIKDRIAELKQSEESE